MQRKKLAFIPIRCGIGAVAGRGTISRWKIGSEAVGHQSTNILDRVRVKAIACEEVHRTETPLSRLSISDIARRCWKEDLDISASTVGRILRTDALQPWRYRYWIFPRVKGFAERAGPILDLYGGCWQGKPLRKDEYVISADEKTSIQARSRDDRLPPEPGQAARLEHEYEREGAWNYLAAWDVHRGVAIGRCEQRKGIEPFKRLVHQVMQQDPYRRARRVFWIVDNDTAHRGEKSIERMRQWFPKVVLLHTPVHASWINQIEIYFSIVQRKVLTPNDFDSLDQLAECLSRFEDYFNEYPSPFNWTFDRKRMHRYLNRLKEIRPAA
jgi:hypothetical protein